jgi:hypothetical protein
MAAFIDFTCAKCKKRYGWCGEITDQPPCPSCGHKPDATKLSKDQLELDRFRNFLSERKKRGEGKNDTGGVSGGSSESSKPSDTPP